MLPTFTTVHYLLSSEEIHLFIEVKVVTEQFKTSRLGGESDTHIDANAIFQRFEAAW